MEGKHWTRKHRFWLAAQRFEHPAPQIAFEELVQAMDEAAARRDRLAKQMEELLPSWSLAKVVAAIQALRGIAAISAITLVAEIGDFKRFANPRQLMAYLGLTPSECSSGSKTARGAITKAGNTRARRMLVEGAWTYRLPARMGAEILKRNEVLPQAIKQIPGRRRRGCARDIAGSPRQESQPMSSVSRSRANSPPSPGRLRRTTPSPSWPDGPSGSARGPNSQHEHLRIAGDGGTVGQPSL